MADLADIAQDYIPEINSKETSKHFDSPSEEYCIDCGEEIPQKRRNLGGVKRCIDCQTAFER